MGKDSKSNNGLKDTRHEDFMRELRVHSRELRELRKALNKMLLIMQAQEKDRLDGEDAELPIYHRAHPDYDGPQPGDYVVDAIGKKKVIINPETLEPYSPTISAIPDVIIEDEFVDIRDMGVTQ